MDDLDFDTHLATAQVRRAAEAGPQAANNGHTAPTPQPEPQAEHDPYAATLERFPRLNLGQLLRDDRPEREYVIRGLIPAGASVALVAPAGSKKSLLL
jgi:hypothetical protein